MWSTRLIRSLMSRAPSPHPSLTSLMRRAVIRMWLVLPAYLRRTSLWSLWRAARRLSFLTGRNLTTKPEVRLSFQVMVCTRVIGSSFMTACCTDVVQKLLSYKPCLIKSCMWVSDSCLVGINVNARAQSFPADHNNLSKWSMLIH